MVYSKTEAGKQRRRSTLKKTIHGLLTLSRLSEYVYFVTITTLVGVAAARTRVNWEIFVLVLANLLAVGFAFAVNDIKDAPDDVFSDPKSNRNPISSGLISLKTAKYAASSTAIISMGLFALLGIWPVLFGFFTLFIGYFYSIRRIRLRTIDFFDILSHSLLLSGLPFLIGYSAFSLRLTENWYWPLIFLMAVSAYVELHDQAKHNEDSRQSNNHRADSLPGEKVRIFLLITFMVIILFSGVVSIFLIQLFPAWVIMTAAFLAILFFLPSLIKRLRRENRPKIQASLQKPIERAAALALILQHLIPWLDQLFNLGLFN
jgi:4-hydroxybenzoate polyprenyltransferase